MLYYNPQFDTPKTLKTQRGLGLSWVNLNFNRLIIDTIITNRALNSSTCSIGNEIFTITGKLNM